MQTPLIVEFVGLPGSGKSTIAAGLAAELAYRGLPCELDKGQRLQQLERTRTTWASSRWSKLSSAMSYIAPLRDGRVALTSYRFAASVKPFPNRHALRLSRTLILWFHYLRTLRGERRVLIFDQGLVQMLYATAWWGESCSRKWMREVLKLVSREVSLCLFVTSIDARTLLERIQSRSLRPDHARFRSWMFQDCSMEVQARKIAQGLALTRQIADLCTASGQVAVLGLDTRLPAGTNVAICSKFVDGWISDTVSR